MANKPWLKKKVQVNEITVMGATIKLKPLGFGDSRKATQQAMEINFETKETKIDATLLGTLRTLYQIEDWDLTDDNDQKLPIALETLDELDEGFVNQLIAEVQQASVSQVSADEKKQ